MDEFQLIYDLIAPTAYRRRDVELGIGDDGAVLNLAAGESLVVVADTLVVDRHFPATLPAADIGYRAAAVNLSDIAAMGAEPRWATLALTMPAMDEVWVREFLGGLRAGLCDFNVALVGGDTTRGPLTVTLQLMGAVPIGRALTRRAARPGDLVYASGTLGDAAAGLRLIQGHCESTDASRYLMDRFVRPTPRVRLGQALRDLATSCIDVSDGLLADLGHIATQSACRIVLPADTVPQSAALCASCSADEALRLALTGGDDYELAFTLPEGMEEAATRAAHVAACQITRIGRIESGAGVVVLDATGRELDFAALGYRHF